MKKLTQLIEEQGNFLEIYNPDGSVYLRPLYAADESMLWSAKYLDLKL